MVTAIAYSSRYLEHNQSSHPENAERLKVIVDYIKNSRLSKKVDFINPKSVDDESILSVHSRDMVDTVKTLSETGGWIDFDTYVCKGSYDIAKLAAGGVVYLSEKVLSGDISNGFALVRPPGHHATKTQSMGFCLFNNVAIAANNITKSGKKVLIFDHDIHHGNGTQEIFYDRNDVMYQSFHLSPYYPGTGHVWEIGEREGKGYTVNAPLPMGAGDETLKRVLDEVFIPIARQFKPDIILISAGFDSHYLDQLGGLKLTASTFYEIIKKFQSVQSNMVCTLEGGYNLDLLGKLVSSEIEAMLGEDPSYIDYDIKEDVDGSSVVDDIKKSLGEYWNI